MAGAPISRRSVATGLLAMPLMLAGAARAQTGGTQTGGADEGAPAQADPVRLARADRWTFTGWPGPPVTVFSWVPPGAAPDVPVVIAMHGVNRDGDRYFTDWLPVAEARGFALVAPQFDQGAFPRGANYNQGRLFGEQNRLRPQGEWVFSTLDGIFAAFLNRTRLTTARFHLYGHSAGSQFVHRAMLASPPTRVARTVSANAGFYTWPDARQAWPFGTGRTPFGDAALQAWLGRDMTILLGTADNDPAHRSLNRDPEAMLQGPHRLARGEAFFATGRALAAARGWSFGWSLGYAPGIDHNNAGMAPFAADILLTPQRA